MAAKKITGRSADAAAGAATAAKKAAAAAAARKKQNIAQASDAASRRYSYSKEGIISKRGSNTRTQRSTLKDKKTGITRTTDSFLDNIVEFASRSGYSAKDIKTALSMKGKAVPGKHTTTVRYKDYFGK